MNTFLLSKFFSIQKTKKLDKSDLVTPLKGDKKYPYVTRTVNNNGIESYTGYIDDFHLNPGNSFSLGLLQMNFQWHEEPWYCGQFVRRIVPKYDFSRNVMLYFLSVLQKNSVLFDPQAIKRVDGIFDSLRVDLPVTSDGQLDVQYMEQYIKRIEAQYIKRIEAYLSVLGYDSIDDCELSSQDLKVLSGPDKWGKFRIGSLFKKLSSRYLGSGNKFDAVRKKPSAEFSLPVTYAKYNNNGIMYWGRPADFQHYRNCISVIYNGAVSAGLVFAQKDDTGVLAESYLIDFKSYHNESFEVDLYISVVMKKALYPLYSRENLAVWSKVKDNMIKLPVTPDGKPDYDFMDQYITAIEKKKVLKLKQAMDHKLDLYREMSHQD